MAEAPERLRQARHAARVRHMSRSTEQSYVRSIHRYVLFHRKQHPAQMGAIEIEAFLSCLATGRHASASTALSALLCPVSGLTPRSVASNSTVAVHQVST